MEKNIRQNIRAIRLSLGLSVKRFQELTGISTTTIVNVEQGHKGLKLETINKLISFTDFSIEQITSDNFTVPHNLRETLFEKFKDDDEKNQFFYYKPKIIQAINDKLIGSIFFKSYKEINEIVSFFKESGWIVKGTSLQNELKNHPKVDVIPHPTKKMTNIYKAKEDNKL